MLLLLLFSLACFIASGCQVSRKVITQFTADDTAFTGADGQASSTALVCSLCDATKIGPLVCGSTFSVSTTKSMSTTFSHGSSMTIGTKFSFEAGIEGLFKISAEMDLSATESFTVGQSTTKETTTTESTDCSVTVNSGTAAEMAPTFITSTMVTSFTATVTTYYEDCATVKEATSGTISISNVPTKHTVGTCAPKELGCCGGELCPTMPPTMPPSPPTPMPTPGVYYTVHNVAPPLELPQWSPVHGCKIHYGQCYWETLNEAETGCDQWDQCGALYCTDKHIPATAGHPVCWARQWTVAVPEQGSTTYVKSTEVVDDYVEVDNANVEGVLSQTTPVNRCTIKWGQCYWNNLGDAEWGCNNWDKCNSVYWTGKDTNGAVVGWARTSTEVGYEQGSTAYLATSGLRTSSSHSYTMTAYYASPSIGSAAPVTPAPTYDQEDYVVIHNVAALAVLVQKYPEHNCSVAYDQCYWNSLEEAETNCDEWEQCESLYCTDNHLPATTGNPICWARQWTAAIREGGSTVYVKRAHAGKYVEVENMNAVGVLRQTTPEYNCSIEWEQCYWDNLEDSKSGCGTWDKCHSIYWTDKHAPATPGKPVGWARSSTATASETGSTAFLRTSELLTSKIHHGESERRRLSNRRLSLSSSLVVIPEDAECKAPHNIARSDLVVMGKKLGKKLAVRLATKMGLTDSSLESSDDYEFAK